MATITPLSVWLAYHRALGHNVDKWDCKQLPNTSTRKRKQTMDQSKTYYVIRIGDDRFDLRQTRYGDRLAMGNEHPHDLMAVSFTAQQMRELIAKHFQDTDASALPPL